MNDVDAARPIFGSHPGALRPDEPSYQSTGLPLFRVNRRSGVIDQPLDTGATATALAVGADAAWAAMDDGTVLAIDPATGSIRATVRVGLSTSDIVLGGGSVWVADSVDDVVRKIDPHTDAVVETIRLGNRPGALAYTADRLWVSVY